MGMTIQTSEGKTFDIHFAYAPVFDGSCVAEVTGDERPLAQIAADFEGLAWIRKEDPSLNSETYSGYSELAGVTRQANGNVTVKMVRPRTRRE